MYVHLQRNTVETFELLEDMEDRVKKRVSQTFSLYR